MNEAFYEEINVEWQKWSDEKVRVRLEIRDTPSTSEAKLLRLFQRERQIDEKIKELQRLRDFRDQAYLARRLDFDAITVKDAAPYGTEYVLVLNRSALIVQDELEYDGQKQKRKRKKVK
jgi:hypothetical protein